MSTDTAVTAPTQFVEANGVMLMPQRLLRDSLR